LKKNNFSVLNILIYQDGMIGDKSMRVVEKIKQAIKKYLAIIFYYISLIV